MGLVARSPGSSELVSVCLLAYNHARTLGEAIESLLAQEHKNFELIVSDDSSTDATWQVLLSFADRDARIRPIRTPRNLGMAANANFAVGHARGRYVALLHHDDLCSPRLLSRWLEVAERHPTIAFVSNAYEVRLPSVDAGQVRVDYHPFRELTPGRLALEEIILPNWGCPIRGTALIRTDCWNAVGGMRERFGMLADVDLWMRLSARWDVGYVAEPLITVRHEPPDDYPKDYHQFSWPRFRLLYDIHATNRLEYFKDRAAKRRLEMMRFRWRVSVDELYWLTYAVLKRRWDILKTSDSVANEYEFFAARLLRKSLAASVTSLTGDTD